MPRIKIYTRSFDLRLYRLASGLFRGLKDAEGHPIPCVRLTDKSADGYFYAMLRDRECDIAVNIDEDAFLTDPQAMLDLVARVAKEGYGNAGYRDTTRKEGDPTVTNPFFHVLNLALIRDSFNRKEMVRRPDDLEPYYPFFHWIRDHFPTLYLPAETHPDGITTLAKDESGRTLCMHTWYARFYSMPSWVVRRIQRDQGKQKARIDSVIREAYALRGMELPSFGFGSGVLFALDKYLRWVIKVPQRISRWPGKIARRIARRSGAR